MIEIGHSVLHGAYDRLEGAEAFRSEEFEWVAPIDEASWRIEHNVRHHQYTNILGRDPDLRFGPARLSPGVEHRWYHVLQPYSSVMTWFLFDLAIHLHATGMLDLYMHRDEQPEVLRDKSPETVRAVHRAALHKVVRYYSRELVFFPALAGPFFAKVLLGNVLSEVARNLYTGATIYCGHVDATDYDRGTRARGRHEWYAMQVEASHDFQVPLPFSILCGGLDYQIEHHLFPRLPPNRLREIAPEVQAICEAHGVTYRTASWPRTLFRSLRRLRAIASAKVTRPLRAAASAAPAS
jgi:linoleoyl-CoA desaturase